MCAFARGLQSCAVALGSWTKYFQCHYLYSTLMCTAYRLLVQHLLNESIISEISNHTSLQAKKTCNEPLFRRFSKIHRFRSGHSSQSYGIDNIIMIKLIILATKLILFSDGFNIFRYQKALVTI